MTIMRRISAAKIDVLGYLKPGKMSDYDYGKVNICLCLNVGAISLFATGFRDVLQLLFT